MLSFARRLLSSAARRPRAAAAAPTDTGLVLAAVGRANVGKSTLFNRLARGAPGPFVPSVVAAQPGVTRDARRARAAVGGLAFDLVDTAGLEEAPGAGGGRRRAGAEVDTAAAAGAGATRETLLAVGALDPDKVYRELYRGMAAATVAAVRAADAAVFVIDASLGVTAVDLAIARWLRAVRGGGGVVLVANKCDMADARAGCADALALGFGEPIPVSAEHNIGLDGVYAAVRDLHQARLAGLPPSPPPLPAPPAVASEREAAEEDDEYGDEDGELLFDPDFVRDPPITRLAVSLIGRPNVGKSSLLAALTGRDGALVSPAAGVTRDAVLVEWAPRGPAADPLCLVDTAGIRARASLRAAPVEQLSVQASLRALRLSHVAVLVVDANDGLTDQDVKIAHVAITEGRAVVLAVNKMDCVRGRGEADALRELIACKVRTSLHHIAGVEVVEMSTRDWPATGVTQAAQLYGAIQRARRRWERRIPTSALTRYVTRFNETTAVGMSGAKRGRRGTTKFISQKKTRPPMFRLDGSSAVSENYIRALTNGIRAEFGLEGVPIRVKRPSRRQRR
jgi:GTPase